MNKCTSTKHIGKITEILCKEIAEDSYNQRTILVSKYEYEALWLNPMKKSPMSLKILASLSMNYNYVKVLWDQKN